MDKYIFVGKDLDNALEVAKKGLNSRFVEFEVLEEASKGFLGLGKRDCKLLVWLDPAEVPTPLNDSLPVGPVSKDIQRYKEPSTAVAEEIKEPVKQAAPAVKQAAPQQAEKKKTAVVKEEKKPAPKKETIKKDPIIKDSSSEEEEDAVSADLPPVDLEYVRTYVQTLIDKMSIDCKISVKEGEKNIEVLLEEGDIGSVIGRRGETLNSLQYLVNLHINKGRRGDHYKRINIDSADYRHRREEALKRLAKGVAGRVIKTGKDVTLEPMEPYERRIIHAELQNNRKIGTKSIGEEPNRKIVVYLKG